MDRPLLTIGIPTYNRVEMLETCLAALLPQVQAAGAQVEVFISDNASTDDTPAVISRYGPQLPGFRHHRQPENLGPDLNIAECFRQARGQYVWVFSDDDLLLPGSLAHVLEVLSEAEPFGVLSLQPTFFPNEVADAVLRPEPFRYEERTDPVAFMGERHIWFSYISGTITNRDLVAGLPSLYEFAGTYLIQLGWTLPALFRARRNAFLPTQLLLGRTQPMLSYRLMRVFSLSVVQVLDGLSRRELLPPPAKAAMCRAMLRTFLPPLLPPGHQFHYGEKPFWMWAKAYWRYPEYWTHILPAFARRLYVPPLSAAKKPVHQRSLKAVGRALASNAWHELGQTRSRLRHFGLNSQLPLVHEIVNPEFVSIGRRFQARPGLRIEVHLPAAGGFEPAVVIGDDVQLGADCHLGCSERIELGNHVLIGNKVLLTDHGRDDSAAARELPPAQRPRRAGGPVVIEANVLIEDGATLVGPVRVGHGAIVRAGAVVRHDVAVGATVAGNPALPV